MIITVILFLIIGISLTAKGAQVTGQEQQSYLIPGIIFLLISFAIAGFYMFRRDPDDWWRRQYFSGRLRNSYTMKLVDPWWTEYIWW